MGIMSIDRIGNLNIDQVRPTIGRVVNSQIIVGARAIPHAIAAEALQLSITGKISESTPALAQAKKRQLAELVGNIGYPYHYFSWGVSLLNQWDGWYVIQPNSLSFTEDWTTLSVIPFSLNLIRLGTAGNLIPSQYWSAAAEITSGFTSPTATTMVSFPNSAADIDVAIVSTVTTSDGTIQLVDNPSLATLEYTPSATLANWVKGECRVYDSVTAGNATEANWVQVLGAEHVFTGDAIFQNGLLRYIIHAGVGTFYAYDSGAAAAWKTVGQFRTLLTGILDTTVSGVGTLIITPDEIRWFERRHYGTYRLYVEYTLRRGAMYCRADITTTSLGIDTATYVQLLKTGGFAQLFNAGASGAAGAGNLAAQASSNYLCSYNTADQIVSGFALCDKPAFQPIDDVGAGGNSVPCSLTWTASQTRTIFIIAFPANTASINLTTERAKAAAIAAHCLMSVQQELDLVRVGFKV